MPSSTSTILIQQNVRPSAPTEQEGRTDDKYKQLMIKYGKTMAKGKECVN